MRRHFTTVLTLGLLSISLGCCHPGRHVAGVCDCDPGVRGCDCYGATIAPTKVEVVKPKKTEKLPEPAEAKSGK